MSSYLHVFVYGSAPFTDVVEWPPTDQMWLELVLVYEGLE